jgi:predicted ester cyclase
VRTAGVEAAGQRVVIPFTWVYRFSGGKTLEGWGLLNQLALARQIGGRIVPA